MRTTSDSTDIVLSFCATATVAARSLKAELEGYGMSVWCPQEERLLESSGSARCAPSPSLPCPCTLSGKQVVVVVRPQNPPQVW